VYTRGPPAGGARFPGPLRCYTPEMRQCAGRLATALLCALAALPAVGSEGPRWLKIQSPNFELFTTAGERNGREVARHFEQVRAFFREAMGLGLKSGPPVRIVVFRADKPKDGSGGAP